MVEGIENANQSFEVKWCLALSLTLYFYSVIYNVINSVINSVICSAIYSAMYSVIYSVIYSDYNCVIYSGISWCVKRVLQHRVPWNALLSKRRRWNFCNRIDQTGGDPLIWICPSDDGNLAT